MYIKKLKHVISNDDRKGSLFVKVDRFIALSDTYNRRDLLEILLVDKHRVMIRYSLLPKYYIKEVDGRVKISKTGDTNVFRMLKKDNGKYAFISDTSKLALTVDENRDIILTKYKKSNVAQEFTVECINI